MTVKTGGLSALILATGLLACLAGPSNAAATTDRNSANPKSESSGAPGKYARHGAYRWKRYAHHRSHRVAVRSSTEQTTEAADDGDHSTAIPPSVANANAQLASADSPTGNAARAMTARANDILQNAPDKAVDAQAAPGSQVVAADQLNDVDRALQQPAPPPAVAMASAEAPAAPAPPVMASNNESSTSDQASLIGKIFIGFGALLTMGSAARMFMA
ncbi:MAG TPA: hypothetical protein VN065_20845 [Bradyrhizobium sp.]|jgi:hypothetical protein|nr:hypothetical protein [Bradyrhizobium sp.]